MTLMFLRTNTKTEAKITFLLISDLFVKNTFRSFPNESQNCYLNCLKGTSRELLLKRNFYVSNFLALIIHYHTLTATEAAKCLLHLNIYIIPTSLQVFKISLLIPLVSQCRVSPWFTKDKMSLQRPVAMSVSFLCLQENLENQYVFVIL